MQDWDRVAGLVIGVAVAVPSSIDGWRSWQQGQRKAAVGAVLLAVVSVVLPAALAMGGR